MLKQRVVASIVMRKDIVVQSVGFKKYLPIGELKFVAKFACEWGVDELLIIDIEASKNNELIATDLLRDSLRQVNIPVTVGGGVRSVDDVKQLLRCGADKVILNSSFWERSELIPKIIKKFGAQCVVLSIDCVKVSDTYYVYDHISASLREENISEALSFANAQGVGEILLRSIEKDGSGDGMDLELLKLVPKGVSCPIILAGGVSRPSHIVEALETGIVQAVAVGNRLQHSEHSAHQIKSRIQELGIAQRMAFKTKAANRVYDSQERPL